MSGCSNLIVDSGYDAKFKTLFIVITQQKFSLSEIHLTRKEGSDPINGVETQLIASLCI